MYYTPHNGKSEYNIVHTSFLPFPWRHLPLDKDPYLGKNSYFFIGKCKLYHFVPFLTRFLADFEFRTSSSIEMAATTPLFRLTLNTSYVEGSGHLDQIQNLPENAIKHSENVSVCAVHIYTNKKIISRKGGFTTEKEQRGRPEKRDMGKIVF